jgi:hypothetical protein
MRNALKRCSLAALLALALPDQASAMPAAPLTPRVHEGGTITQVGHGCRVLWDCSRLGCGWRRVCWRVPIQPYYDFYTYPPEYWGHYRPWRPWNRLY